MRYLPSKTPVVEFGMACNRQFKDAQGQDREEVMFIDCSAFGKQAEIINQYCQKGDLLFVEGRLKLDTWEDKQGGGKRSKHRVVIENFQLMPRRDGGGGGGAGGGEGAGRLSRLPRRSAPCSGPPGPAAAAPPAAEPAAALRRRTAVQRRRYSVLVISHWSLVRPCQLTNDQ